MGEQSQLEENKRIIESYYESYNNRDWEDLADLIHENVRHNEIIPDDDGYRKSRRELSIKFMLGIFDPETRKRMDKKWKKGMQKMKTSTKQGMVDRFLSTAEREKIHRKIIRMISEGNEVWVKERYSGIGFYEKAEYGFEQDSIYVLKDGKIIDTYEFSDQFVFYIQLGGIKARTENREDLVAYLDSLKEIGLIPENVGVTD